MKATVVFITGLLSGLIVCFLFRDETTTIRVSTAVRATVEASEAEVVARPAKAPSSPKAPARVLTVSRRRAVDFLPAELPHSEWLVEELRKYNENPREAYSYMLGLVKFYDSCAGDGMPAGKIYYYIDWEVGEDHVASFLGAHPYGGEPLDGAVATIEQEDLFIRCVDEYLDQHPTVVLPVTAVGTTGTWGMSATFPVSESPLVKLLAEAARH